jgi:predicted ArsR family transcriptional regulator
MADERSGDAIAAVAVLGDGLRRALYDYVAGRGVPVGRDEAAEAVGVKRPLAAYHLDRLARGGLLDVHFERPDGRGGPGAGRPAKLYRRSRAEIAVTLPSRRYDLAADLLAAAVDDSGPSAVAAVAARAAAAGDELASRLTDGAVRSDPDTARAAMTTVLAERGYEPYDEGGAIRLRNCPFHHLAQAHTALVCGMNLSLLRAAASRCAVLPVTPVADPRPGECCVAFVPTGL